MKNKVLIKLMVPEIDITFDVFIPVNESIWKIKKILAKCITDLTKINFDTEKSYVLINKDTCQIYDNNVIVINTDIRNCTELLFVSREG